MGSQNESQTLQSGEATQEQGKEISFSQKKYEYFDHALIKEAHPVIQTAAQFIERISEQLSEVDKEEATKLVELLNALPEYELQLINNLPGKWIFHSAAGICLEKSVSDLDTFLKERR